MALVGCLLVVGWLLWLVVCWLLVGCCFAANACRASSSASPGSAEQQAADWLQMICFEASTLCPRRPRPPSTQPDQHPTNQDPTRIQPESNQHPPRHPRSRVDASTLPANLKSYVGAHRWRPSVLLAFHCLHPNQDPTNQNPNPSRLQPGSNQHPPSIHPAGWWMDTSKTDPTQVQHGGSNTDPTRI